MNQLRPNFCACYAAPVLSHRRALTIIELLVVVVIISILITISLAALARAQQARGRAMCAGNLRSIGLAFQSYASDNGDVFPLPTVNAQWEDLLRNYIRRSTFCCPSDQELYPATGSSYDWRDTGDPAASLAGKRTADIVRSDVSLAFDALPGWHEAHKIQIVFTDASVHSLSDDCFLKELQMPVFKGP